MAVVPCGFSPNGEYFAFSSPDGTLKLYKSATGTLEQEYTPSSHLSATCTCLSWCPARHSNEFPHKRKKKRKSDIGTAVQSLDLVAIGTTSGSLLLYSVIKGDLHTQLSGGHSENVTCTCWSVSGDTLYSCSNDQHIVQWCLASASVKHKWKADKGSVTCISVCPTDRHLLSAGRTIKLWDLDTHQLLKTFTGHSSEVLSLFPVLGHGAIASPSPSQNGGASADAAAVSTVEGTYFLSAAVGDRLVSAWQVNTSSKDKSSIASFALTEEPVRMHISPPAREGQPFLMLVVTRSGQLHVFEYVLNGRCKKPVQPKLTIQIATETSTALGGAGGKAPVPRPIPVLGATIMGDNDRSVMLAHGTLLKPTIEKLPSESLDKDVCLIREDPNKTVMHTQQSVSKVKTPGMPSEVTVLAPGHMAPQLPARADPDGEPKGRRKRRKSSTEMTMEDRLNAISMDGEAKTPAPQSDGKTPPKADTLAILLAQGLQSQDKKILNHVLQNNNMTLIRNTVRRLPVPVIVPLVQELSRRMHGHAQSGQTFVKWVKTVLTMHTSYLMTFPDLVESLGSLYQMMESRVTTYSRLSRLQGKLHLMLAQVSSQEQAEEEKGAAQQPLLLYQDESSEDEFAMEDMFPDQGESDQDNWEDVIADEEGSGQPTGDKESSSEGEEEDMEDDAEGSEEEEEDSDKEEEEENMSDEG